MMTSHENQESLWQLHQSSPYRQISILFLMTYPVQVKSYAENHNNSMEKFKRDNLFVFMFVIKRHSVGDLYDCLSNVNIWCFLTRARKHAIFQIFNKVQFNNGHVPSICWNCDDSIAWVDRFVLFCVFFTATFVQHTWILS